MIKLDKNTEPSVLTMNKESWTEEFKSNSKSNKYAHRNIRDALIRETHNKCAYCESYMLDVSYSHIEHIIPKSKNPELVCEWTNLTIACEKCNISKGDYSSEQLPLLNPYTDDIDSHLYWAGPMLSFKTIEKGKLTINKLSLNRAELFYSRATVLEKLNSLMVQIENSDQLVAEVLREDIEKYINPEAEYSAAAKAFISNL